MQLVNDREMRKILSRIFLFTVVIAATLSGCSLRNSFQPPPPMFEVWRKSGDSSQDVISSMKKCELDEITGYHINKSVKDTFHGEECMKRLGYKLDGTYQGICASKVAQNTIECRNILQEKK